MAKNFSFRSLFVPATPRSKALRGKAGTVVVNNQSAGVPNTPATTVVNNYNITNNYTQEGGGVQVIRITIADLLALTPDQIQVSDIYAVHSSGSDESGWSKDEEFELYGKKYPDGSYAQYVDGVWLIADKDVVKTENEAIFNPLQKVVSLISKIFSQSSYSNLPGRAKAGIPIAEIRNYELDETGVYQEKKESQSGTYAAETNVMTLLVPYARSYEQGGETQYSGGALTAADYKKLCEGGGKVDDVQVDGVSVVENKVAKIDLSNYVDKDSTQYIEGTKRFKWLSVVSIYENGGWTSGGIAFMRGDDYVASLEIGRDTEGNLQCEIFDFSEYKSKNLAFEGDFFNNIWTGAKNVPCDGGTINFLDLGVPNKDYNAGFATQTWVNSQGFLKTIPSTYAKKEDLVGYATQGWVLGELDKYADKTWVNSQGFLKADDVKKFASTEFVYISVTNNGSSYDFEIEDKSFATATVRDDSTTDRIKLELGFFSVAAAREFLRDYRVCVTQTNSTVQFTDTAGIVEVDYLGTHIWLEIVITQGTVHPDPTAWYAIQFTKLNNIQR